MGFHINITADNAYLLRLQVAELAELFTAPVVATPEITKPNIEDPALVTASVVNETVEPVITQERMEENIANAPVHEEPPVPTLEEVRAALKKLRDKKGAAVV